jgi:tetratricopeptide (TPR) repeat protein
MSEANDCFTHAAELAPDQPQLFVDAGWWVAGPYPVDRILQAPLESDPAPDPSKPADVFATEPRRWQNVRTEPQGKVDLGSIFHADKIEAYALAIVYSASKRDVVAVLSNDDEASYWLNGRHFLDAPFIPSEAGRPMLMTLQAGRNTILAKVINQRLGHAMSVQFSEVPADVVRAFAGAGKWAQAADEYSKVLANESGKANRATHNDAGRAYAELGRWKDAAAAFKRAYNLDSKNYETRQDLLRCYLALNDAASYQPLCKKLIEDYRKDQHPTIRNDVIWNAALLPGALPDYSEVLQIAAKLMDLKTAGATYFNTYGAIIYRAKHYSAAVNYLTKSIHAKAGKGDAFDLVFLAMARHRLKQPGASDALKQAVALANEANYNWEFRIEIQTLLDEAKMELSLP